MFSLHLTLVCATVYVLFAERIFLKVASGGRGVLQLMPPVIIVLAAALIMISRRRGGGRFLNQREFWLYWSPYLLMTTLLPVFGVLLTDYPPRTVMSIMQGILSFSFLAMGSWLTVSGTAGRRLAAKYLFAVIVAEFLYASVQFARAQGFLPAGLLDSLYRWDLLSQVAYSKDYVIAGRSIGTFVNPNNLGFFAVIAFWSAVHVFRGAPRIAAVAAALGTLAMSQSRGSVLALLLSLAVWLAYLAMSKDKTLRPALDITFALVMASIVGVLAALAISDPGRLSSRIGQRFESGLAVISGGVAMDPSVQGRVDAWSRALDFYEQRPLGTFGEPQLLFGGFIDNEFVRILLQGGPVFLAATILALGAGIRLVKFGTVGRMIGTFSAAIAVNAVTANPLSYPAIGLYWMVVGYYLAGRERLELA